jgi:hypothetical protein
MRTLPTCTGGVGAVHLGGLVVRAAGAQVVWHVRLEACGEQSKVCVSMAVNSISKNECASTVDNDLPSAGPGGAGAGGGSPAGGKVILSPPGTVQAGSSLSSSVQLLGDCTSGMPV